MPTDFGRVQARINLQALKSNFQLAKSSAGNSRVVAVIKANAYGHGLSPVAQALSAADLYGVTDVQEALQLEAADVSKPILILQGLIRPEDLLPVAEYNFHLVIHSLEQLAFLDEAIDRLPLRSPLTFWLKMDSGMGRLGLAPEDYVSAWQKLSAKPYTANIIMMTHLANASLPASPLNLTQLNDFFQCQEALGQVPVSIPSSAGILGDYEIPSDWVRPGLMLYGSSPFGYDDESRRASSIGLKPVMTLQSKIIAVKDMKAGDNVGYCSQFICPTDMKIGIVCIGYADGYPSNAPNGTPVLVDGQRSNTVGRVSMDMLAVDLSHLPDTQPGAPVTLWGEGLCIDEIAAHTGIISYNLMCSVTRRVIYIYGNSE